MPALRVIIADDHALFRGGLTAMFTRLCPEVTVVAEVEMVSMVEQLGPPTGLHEVGENIAVAPLGSGDAEKLTVQTEQADEAVMVVVPEAP